MANFNYSTYFDMDIDHDEIHTFEMDTDEISVTWEVWLTIFVQIFRVFTALVGLVGNTLVIFVIVRFRKMRTITNLYILNLAIADECFLFGTPLLIAEGLFDDWHFGEFLCKFRFASIPMNYIASSFFLLVIAGDRYFMVCHPLFSAKWRTRGIAISVILITWALAICPLIPVFIYSGIVTDEAFGPGIDLSNMTFCTTPWEKLEEELGLDHKMFVTHTFSIGFAIPLVFIVIFYMFVIRQLKLTKEISGGNKLPEEENANHFPVQNTRIRDYEKSRGKVTRMILIVVTCFFTCWGPFWLFQWMSYYLGYFWTMQPISECLAFSNSAINPFIYAFLSEKFRKCFKKVCACSADKASGDNESVNSADSTSENHEAYTMMVFSTA